jgi:hypothetical protein
VCFRWRLLPHRLPVLLGKRPLGKKP